MRMRPFTIGIPAEVLESLERIRRRRVNANPYLRLTAPDLIREAVLKFIEVERGYEAKAEDGPRRITGDGRVTKIETYVPAARRKAGSDRRRAR